MSDEKGKRFTIDAEITGMIDIPSVSRLLNRKTLESTRPSPKMPPPPPEPTEPLDIPDSFSPLPSAEPVTIQAADSASPMPIAMPIETIEPASTGIELAPSSGNTIFHLEIGSPVDPTPPAQNTSGLPSAAAPYQATVVHHSAEVKRAQRKPQAPIQELLAWEIETLRTGADPMAKALINLIDTANLSGALFLSMDPSSTPQQIQLAASASWASQRKKNAWKGMKWNSKIAPELWNHFLTAGYVELDPLTTSGGTTVHMAQNRFIREVFAVGADEWFVLVRIGTQASCRGMLALVSPTHMKIQLPKILHLFSAAPKAA